MTSYSSKKGLSAPFATIHIKVLFQDSPSLCRKEIVKEQVESESYG